MSTKIKAVPEGFHAVTPCLTLKNSVEAIEFYKKAFGAKALDVFPSPDGKRTMHAVMQIGNSILMMGDEMPGQNCKSAASLGASPISLFLYVPNADAVFKQAVDAGAIAVMPIADMFWGDRCGTVKDPFGYTWMIATHTRDMTRKEIEEGARSFAAQAGKP
ncbi:MAG: VOC family protein [Kiritimatiellales bacterium]